MTQPAVGNFGLGEPHRSGMRVASFSNQETREDDRVGAWESDLEYIFCGNRSAAKKSVQSRGSRGANQAVALRVFAISRSREWVPFAALGPKRSMLGCQNPSSPSRRCDDVVREEVGVVGEREVW